jgi:hypothetical protein
MFVIGNVDGNNVLKMDAQHLMPHVDIHLKVQPS